MPSSSAYMPGGPAAGRSVRVDGGGGGFGRGAGLGAFAATGMIGEARPSARSSAWLRSMLARRSTS